MTKSKTKTASLDNFRIEPLTSNNWGKFVTLFGERGACGNCWCMYYRLGNADFREGKTDDGNKRAMKDIVNQGKPAGLMGFIDEQPVAWCAFAPREDFIRLENSRVHKRIDAKAVWSIPCLFIDKNFRRSGISSALLKGAIQYARENRIEIIEAYPGIPTQDKTPDSFVWFGIFNSFLRAGFETVDRTSKNRPMVRYYVSR